MHHSVYCQDEPQVVSFSPTVLAGCSQVKARYHWRVRADKPLLRHLSILFKLVFEAKHHWEWSGERRVFEENWYVAVTSLDGTDSSSLPNNWASKTWGTVRSMASDPMPYAASSTDITS